VLGDERGVLTERYDARPGTCYLFRPDQHVCARWRKLDLAAVRAAIARATANGDMRHEAAMNTNVDNRKGEGGIMTTLNTQPNLAAADDFYEELIAMHRGLSDAQSTAVNAKLILLLANHIGDMEVLRAAMTAARDDATLEQDAR